jgi:hypothetical protein
MPHNTGLIVVGLLGALGGGLFLYSMFLAGQGWLGMKLARVQKAAADAEFAATQALTTRCNSLRDAVKTSYGADYAEVIEPIDLIISYSVTALLANDRNSGMDLLNEACYEMEALLRPSSV